MKNEKVWSPGYFTFCFKLDTLEIFRVFSSPKQRLAIICRSFVMYTVKRLWSIIMNRRGVGWGLAIGFLITVSITYVILLQGNHPYTNLNITLTFPSPEGTVDPFSDMDSVEAKMEKYWSDQRWEKLSNVKMEPMNDLIQVLLCGDEHSLPGMVATLNSVRKNTKHPVKFYILTNDHTLPHLKDWIAKSELKRINYVVKTFDMESIQKKITVYGDRRDLMDPLNYARYYVPEYFPEIQGNLIYLDCDTVVLGDLWELYSTMWDDDKMIAFSDDCSPAFKHFNEGMDSYDKYLNFNHKLIRKLELNPKACSFNAGVYVVDMNAWKEMNATKKLDSWLTENHKSTEENMVYGGGRHSYGSQPPMMIVFYNKWQKLSAKWNIRHLGNLKASGLYSDTLIEEAKLLHWTGAYKPYLQSKLKALYRPLWKAYFVPDPSMKFMLP